MIRIQAGSSIERAINSAPLGPQTFILEEGIYREKLLISRSDVTLIGEGRVVIDFDDRHGTIAYGKELNTGDSATFTVGAPNFKAENITFQNSFDYPRWHEWNKVNPSSRIDTQAVAVRSVFGATRTTFENCTFIGYQDTLYLDVGCHYFNNCTIYGCVDFIFGAGQVLIENTQIISNGEGFVAAPSTFDSEELGFVFFNCHLSSLAGNDDSVYLARPWHPAGSLNRSPMAAFIDCELGSHIKKELWTHMHSRTPKGVERNWLPEESRFTVSTLNCSKELLEKAKLLCEFC